MIQTYEIIVTSLPEKENLIAEIWIEGNIFAEISSEIQDELSICFFCRKDQKSWEISFDYLQFLLAEARIKLLA